MLSFYFWEVRIFEKDIATSLLYCIDRKHIYILWDCELFSCSFDEAANVGGTVGRN